MNTFMKSPTENNRFKSYLMAAAGVLMCSFTGKPILESTNQQPY